VTAAVLTVSDGVSEGTREDKSGDLLQELLEGEGHDVVRRVVRDDRDEIARAIEELADEAALVLTTGGTGLGPRDVTPEATASVLDRKAPGIAEAIRADSIAKTPHALLSRGLAGVRGRTLVVNLPGSPGGCRDGFAVLRPALAHALELLAGERDVGHRQTLPRRRSSIRAASRRWSRSSTRSSRSRSRTSVRSWRLAACPVPTTSSGSPWRWSARGRWRWA